MTYEDLGSFEELGLKREGLRYGVQIRILGEMDTVDVMAVHLKSGCFVDDFSSSDRSACEVLEQQVPVLDHWIETHVLKSKNLLFWATLTIAWQMRKIKCGISYPKYKAHR